MSAVEALKAWQRTHHNHLGRPLEVDGARGPETRWAEAFELLSEDQKLVLREAQGWLGEQERPPGSNRSLRIDQANGRCGVPLGSPWCASSASDCLSVVRNVRCASALGFARWAEEECSEPAPARLWAFPTDAQGHGHCGLVAGWEFARAEIMTYEGNVDSGFRCLLRSTEGMRFWRFCEEAGDGLPLVLKGTAWRRNALVGTR